MRVFVCPGVVLFFCMATMVGCGGGGGIEKVVVSGTVTWQGEPVPNGEIRFQPVGDTEGPVAGAPIKDGKYTVEGRGGVPVGKHLVKIQAYRAAQGKEDPALRGEGGPAEQYLPPEYNDKSEMTVEVSRKNAKHDFNLPLNQ